MEIFGWTDYVNQIASNWKKLISPDDLVLIAGDISWGSSLESALPDLEFIHALPGTKVISKGNHDYWWPSSKKLSSALPSSIHFIHNNAFNWNDVTIGGTRLWDTPEYNFNAFIEFTDNPREKEKEPLDNEKIFNRELERLHLSLKQLSPHAKLRIAMVHYPPIPADLSPSKTSSILEHYQIDHCIFGHLHSVKPNALPFGPARGVNYHFTSADYLNFTPISLI